MRENISGLLGELHDIAELIYQQRINEGYAKLNLTLAHLSVVYDAILAYKQEHPELEIDQIHLLENLSAAMQAMTNNDAVLLADIIQYDICEQLDNILKQIQD